MKDVKKLFWEKVNGCVYWTIGPVPGTTYKKLKVRFKEGTPVYELQVDVGNITETDLFLLESYEHKN
jgi:hypothetical protein